MYCTTYSRFYTGLVVLLVLTGPSLECGPGRTAGKRKRPAKMIPLVHKQGVPNLSENTIGASGLSEGAITRDDPKFKQLVTNDNPNIIFKDEEGNGSDRIMSQVCSMYRSSATFLVLFIIINFFFLYCYFCHLFC